MKLSAVRKYWPLMEPSVDCKGNTVIPGLIDVHVHGGGGYHMMAADYENLDGMSRFHASHGTTSFLATTTTHTMERIRTALSNAATSYKEGLKGADLIGVHLEGPYLNAIRGDAQDRSTLRIPLIEELEQFLDDSNNLQTS